MSSVVEERRKELGLSQDDVAKKSNISRQYYNAIENNRRTPSVDLAKALGDVLGFRWTIFFEDSVNN